MQDLWTTYLRSLSLMAAVLLKDDSFRHIRRMWLELPLAYSNAEAQLILNEVFHLNNVDTSALPPVVLARLTEAMLVGEETPWVELTILALESIIAGAGTTLEKHEALNAKVWMLDSRPMVEDRNVLCQYILLYTTRKPKFTNL